MRGKPEPRRRVDEGVEDDEGFDEVEEEEEEEAEEGLEERRRCLTRKSKRMSAKMMKKPMIIMKKPGDEMNVCHVISSAEESNEREDFQGDEKVNDK